MAIKCKKCGEIIPDIMIDIKDNRNDCKNHTKPEININHKNHVVCKINEEQT